MLNKFLFPIYRYGDRDSWYLLLGRVCVAVLLFIHGWNKITHASTLIHTFPNPIGIGSEASFILATCAETLCCIAVALGFLWRLALIPIIINFIVVVFVVQWSQGFAAVEPGMLYLIIFLLLYFWGPGDYSIDGWIERSWRRKHHTPKQTQGL